MITTQYSYRIVFWIAFVGAFCLKNTDAVAQFKISGTVTGNEKEPLEFVTVTMNHAADSSLYKVTDTDTKGFFEVNDVVAGNYFLQFFYVGYGTTNYDLTVAEDKELTIELSSNVQLDEVVVTSRKPVLIRKPDRLIFNVENSVISLSGDATAVLGTLPRLMVGQSSIQMIGKGEMLVLYNDKLLRLSGEDLMSFLKSIPATEIETIEIISNPPAKYDAEGNVGLINIKTKRKIDFGWKGGLNAGFEQYRESIWSLGSNFRYGKGKIGAFGSLNYYKGSRQPIERAQYTFADQYWNYLDERRDFTNTLSANAGLDFDINSKNSLSLQYIGAFRRPDIEEEIEQQMFSPDKNGTLDSIQLSSAFNDRKTNLHQLNFNYRIITDTLGGSMTLSGDYLNYVSENDRLFSNSVDIPGKGILRDSTDVNNNSLQDVEAVTLQLDNTKSIDGYDMSFGGKISRVEIQSNVAHNLVRGGEVTNVPGLSNVYNYKELTEALYASIERSWDKLGVQIGGRIEFTQIDGDSDVDFTDDYVRFFPTAYIEYAINDNNILNISYGKRISRPSYWDLNPFRWILTPTSYVSGNPSLRPTLNHNFEFSYSLNDSYYFTVYGNYINDFYAKTTVEDEAADIIAWRPLILGDAFSYNVDFTASNQVSAWWDTENSVWVTRYKLISDDFGREDDYDNLSVGFYSGNYFYLNKSKTVVGQLTAQILFPGSYSGIHELGGVYNLSLGVQMPVLKNKGSLGISVTDLLDRMVPTTNGVVGDLRIYSNNNYDMRAVKLLFRYNFGNNESKLKYKQLKQSNNNEKARLKN